MEIAIKSCLDGAREARGISVIIDVFRASNTIIACLGKKAKYVIPVNDLDRAYGLKKKYPDHLLFGERKGLPPKGFDFDNSPAKASALNLDKKKVILTTSAGSQGIVNAINSDEILIGSFANAKAVVDYIRKKNPKKVSLIAIGFESYKKAEEDELCAKYIKQKLLGKNPDFEGIKGKISKCDGARRLRTLGQEDDLDFSLKLDVYNLVPRYNKNTKRITKIL